MHEQEETIEFKVPLRKLQNLYIDLCEITTNVLSEHLEKVIEHTFVIPILKTHNSTLLLDEFEKYLTALWKIGQSSISDEIYDIFINALSKNGVLLFHISYIKKKYYPHKPEHIAKIIKIYNNEVVVMPKIDGVSGIITIQSKKIILTTKERDGKFRDISYKVPFLECYNELLDIQTRMNEPDRQWTNNLVLRGEIIVKNRYLNDNSHPSKPLGRSLANGFIMKKENQSNLYPMSFIVFNAHIYKSENLTLAKRLNLMKELKLDTVPFLEKCMIQDVDEIESPKYWNDLRESFQSDCGLDGVVVTDILGNPHFAIKFSSEEIYVEILDIVWSFRRQSYVPIVYFSDVMCSLNFNKMSMSNYQKLVSNRVHIGSTIAIKIVGNTSATFVRTIRHNSNISDDDYKFPKDAIVCERKLVKNISDEKIDITGFQLFLKALGVTGIGKTFSSQIFDTIDTKNVDTIIQSLKLLRPTTSSITTHIQDILISVQDGISLSYVLAITPDSVHMTPDSVQKCITANETVVTRMLADKNLENLNLIHNTERIGELKTNSFKRRLEKFILSNIREILVYV